MKVGYIRVSSVDQNTARQLDGIELDKVFEEKLSGKNIKDRPELQECLNFLRDKDVLLVHSIDRLARNQRDLQNIVGDLVAKGVSIKFVTENLEFGNKDNPMGNLMLQMMGAFAEFERTMIKSRQREGIRKAKERGQQFGRKSLKPKLVVELKNRKEKGQSVKEIAFAMNIGSSTIYNEIIYQNKNTVGNRKRANTFLNKIAKWFYNEPKRSAARRKNVI